jgi:hypothetical protein
VCLLAVITAATSTATATATATAIVSLTSLSVIIIFNTLSFSPYNEYTQFTIHVVVIQKWFPGFLQGEKIIQPQI